MTDDGPLSAHRRLSPSFRPRRDVSDADCGNPYLYLSQKMGRGQRNRKAMPVHTGIVRALRHLRHAGHGRTHPRRKHRQVWSGPPNLSRRATRVTPASTDHPGPLGSRPRAVPGQVPQGPGYKALFDALEYRLGLVQHVLPERRTNPGDFVGTGRWDRERRRGRGGLWAELNGP